MPNECKEVSNILNEKSNCIYRLYAVILHEGNIDGGHYIALCRNGEKWYTCNDDRISDTDIDDVLNHKNAYILFYELIQ